MVCIFCKNETHVTNSRSKARTPAVWRRRVCQTCLRHFTTNELPDYEKSLLVIGITNKKQHLNRDRLYLSLHKSLSHRKDSIDSATALTTTVISRIINKKHVVNSCVSTKSIAKVSIEVLKRFDPLAAATYKAYHQPALK